MKKNIAKKFLFTFICCQVIIVNTVVAQEVNSAASKLNSKQKLDAKVNFPDTFAGRESDKWLRIFNSGDYEAMRAYYDAFSSTNVVEDAAFAYSVYLDTRGFDILRLEQSSEYELRLLAKEKISGQWILARVRYDEKEPHRQTAFGYGYVYPPADVPPAASKMSSEQIARQLDMLMKKLVQADIFSGAVLVAKDDKIIFKKAYGLASKAYGIPNRTNTKFNIGSITKLFTAVAVVKLAQEGKLSFGDPVGKYLTDYPNKAFAEKATVQQLLTHTSGIGRMERLSAQGLALRPRLRTVGAWFPLFVDRPLMFEPGTRWRYSNEGYILLGAIIEKASGQSYFDYVKEHVFKPAGMEETEFYELDTDTPNLATGYTRDSVTSRLQLETRLNNSLLNLVKGNPAGAAYSTVEDLLKFKTALFGNKLLNREYTQLVLNGQVETGEEGTKQAYGFVDETANGFRLINHSGSVYGGEARLEIFPELGYTVISLTNYDYQVVHRRLRDMITQK